MSTQPASNNTNTNDFVSFKGDARWGEVDAYTLSHLHPSTKPNHDALTHAVTNSAANNLPPIAAHPSLAKFLALHALSSGVTYMLEIGTLGAYTPIFLASTLPNLHITTLEVSPHHAAVARFNIEYAGLSDRIEVIQGPAIESLKTIKKEVEAGKREKFGMTFIDADKLNNWNYFDAAVQMSVPRAAVFVDNVVFAGMIVVPEEMGKDYVRGARELIEKAGKDQRVEAVVMQVVAERMYDGILMGVVL